MILCFCVVLYFMIHKSLAFQITMTFCIEPMKKCAIFMWWGGLVPIRKIKSFDFSAINLSIDRLCNNYPRGALFVYSRSCGNEADKVVVGGKLAHYAPSILWHFWLSACRAGKYGAAHANSALPSPGDHDKFLKTSKHTKIDTTFL